MSVSKHGTFEYLAEGAANVVWTVRNLSILHTEQALEQQDYVLRLRKDRPHLASVRESVEAFNTHIRPLFDPSILLSPKLILLPIELIDLMNAELHTMEDDAHDPVRPTNRRGVYLPDHSTEPYGVLLPDLSPKGGQDVLLEFKPKWLVQSPSAPANATKCRNCALRDMRGAQGIVQGRGSHAYCPIDLLSDSENTREMALSSISSRHERAQKLTGQDFKNKVQPLLRHIQMLQRKFCSVSLRDFEHSHSDLRIAMALRDCSVFLQVNVKTGEPRIHGVKLADLDLKVPDAAKLRKWAEMERDLISGGWYLGRRPIETEMYVCALERSDATSYG